MIIIVPAFLYALFLDDLLRYAGDLQEAVLSTPWDLIGQNYEEPSGRKGSGGSDASKRIQAVVQHQARLMFCDHESSGDSYNHGQDCDAQDHHAGRALSGHVCWLNPEAEQVTCDPVRTEVGLLQTPAFRKYQDAFGQAGGLYECHGKEVVENYLMPQSFLQQFSHVDLAKKNWKADGSDYHGNAKAGTGTTAYYLEKQHFALVTDSWALNGDLKASNPGDTLAVRPDDNEGALQERVSLVYTVLPEAQRFLDEDKLFSQVANDQQLLASHLPPQERKTARVSLQKTRMAVPTQRIQEENRASPYFATPWKDGSRDAYEKTGKNRGAYYMGCKTVEGC
ncbi:hypothetical protein [Hyalangium minutum]|uniref:Uncharacterized protein n=1 Tax=Hyalangium minutum TaxID=394096 RepID=A0A085WMP6_9BACT|nr:hypothetical protein [Hyalangium minutum]KFE68959.1 hypothetical protein DB31_6861 [Hyalangium minutum]